MSASRKRRSSSAAISSTISQVKARCGSPPAVPAEPTITGIPAARPARSINRRSLLVAARDAWVWPSFNLESQARVERIAQRIAEQIEGKNCQAECDAGRDCQPRRSLDELDARAAQNQVWRHRVWQHVPQHEPGMARPEAAGRFDKGHPPNRQRAGANDTGHPRD